MEECVDLRRSRCEESGDSETYELTSEKRARSEIDYFIKSSPTPESFFKTCRYESER